MKERQQTVCEINCFDPAEPFLESMHATIGVGVCEEAIIVTIEQGLSVLEIAVSPTAARKLGAWLCRVADSIERLTMNDRDLSASLLLEADRIHGKALVALQGGDLQSAEQHLADAQELLVEAMAALRKARV